MLTMGEELLLIALDRGTGRFRGLWAIQFGLNAAGLAELVDHGYATLDKSGLHRVPDTAPPADDPILAGLHAVLVRAARLHLEPEACVQRWRQPHLRLYLERLKERGVLAWDGTGDPDTGGGRYEVRDADAVAAAHERVDRVAGGGRADRRDRELAAIVLAVGLARYPGPRNAMRRRRLAANARTEELAGLIRRSIPKTVPTKRGGRVIAADPSDDLRTAVDLIRAVESDSTVWLPDMIDPF